MIKLSRVKETTKKTLKNDVINYRKAEVENTTIRELFDQWNDRRHELTCDSIELYYWIIILITGWLWSFWSMFLQNFHISTETTSGILLHGYKNNSSGLARTARKDYNIFGYVIIVCPPGIYEPLRCCEHWGGFSFWYWNFIVYCI